MILYESDRERQSSGLYYAQRRTDLDSHLHLHDSFELVVVEEGTILATVDEADHTLQAGDAFLIFPSQVHGYETPERSQSCVFIFPATLVGEFYEKTCRKLPTVPVFSLRDPSVADALLTAGDNRWQLKSLLYHIVDLFDRGTSYIPRHAKGTELLGQILAFIAEHYREPITMRKVAREMGYDHRYLTNLMQRGLHTTFRRLLNEYRISHAQNLLLRTNSPIEQIAGECGYESLCSFNRNFKAVTNTTPTAFREQNR